MTAGANDCAARNGPPVAVGLDKGEAGQGGVTPTAVGIAGVMVAPLAGDKSRLWPKSREEFAVCKGGARVKYIQHTQETWRKIPRGRAKEKL